MKKYTWIIVLVCIVAVFAFRIVHTEYRGKVQKVRNAGVKLQAEDANSALQIGSKADFNRIVLKADNVALVDFYAVWCPPCRKLSPIIEKIASEANGDYIVAKVNIDKNRDLAKQYGIKSIPTVVIFKNGKEVQRFVGIRSEKTYTSAIKNAQ